jgi:hypothetical protein
LIESGAATPWHEGVKSLNTVPPGKIAVVVIENGPFDAALVMTREEWSGRDIPDRLKHDRRPYSWLLMDVETAAKGAMVEVSQLK